MPDVAVVGDSTIHKSFLDSHVPFLREFGEVQRLADKMWDMALEKYNEPPQTEPKGQELEKYTALRLAQIIVFYLARTTFDAVNDVFILAGNCQGVRRKDDAPLDVRTLGDCIPHRFETGRGKAVRRPSSNPEMEDLV